MGQKRVSPGYLVQRRCRCEVTWSQPSDEPLKCDKPPVPHEIQIWYTQLWSACAGLAASHGLQRCRLAKESMSPGVRLHTTTLTDKHYTASEGEPAVSKACQARSRWLITATGSGQVTPKAASS